METVMKNKTDYSKCKCPYSHIKKDYGHELHEPSGYQSEYGVTVGFAAQRFALIL